MPASPPALSVVVIALNEEKRIGDCLASVRELTDDIVVVDAHSRDCTREVAERAGARVFARAWRGYSDQKNFGNAQARHDWILSLDADERVTPELARCIREEFAHGPSCDAYSIRFRNYFGPRSIRFGAWNPESHVRLFDRRKLEWNTADVHEGLRAVEGVCVGRLRGCIRHLTVESREQLAEKTERYSTLFAENARRRGRTPGWSKVWLNPVWRFARDYVLRLGFLDGTPGAWIAWEAARYTYLKYAKALPVAPRGIRSTHWLSWAGASAMLLFVLLRMANPGHRPARTELEKPTGATIAALDYDDSDDVFDVLADEDDDVLV